MIRDIICVRQSCLFKFLKAKKSISGIPLKPLSINLNHSTSWCSCFPFCSQMIYIQRYFSHNWPQGEQLVSFCSPWIMFKCLMFQTWVDLCIMSATLTQYTVSVQGNPHYHREDKASCASVHSSQLDLRALVWSKIIIPEACRHLCLYDPVAGRVYRDSETQTQF